MGLFDFMKQKGRRTAEPVSYVPECLELPESNYDELFDEFQPEWADQFPDFPYEFQGRPAIRTTLTERMRDMFSIAPQDVPRVESLVRQSNSLLADAHSLATFPEFSVPMPDLSDSYKCLLRFPLCGIRCIPFTEKTGRVSKFPFRFEYDSGMMRKPRSPRAHITMTASLLPDGNPGRIESEYALFENGAAFGHYWKVTSKVVNGELVVSRISEMSPTGDTPPTLYTLGR